MIKVIKIMYILKVINFEVHNRNHKDKVHKKFIKSKHITKNINGKHKIKTYIKSIECHTAIYLRNMTIR
jgi:hypothetical protein